MADFIQGLDPSKLVLVGAALSFVASASVAPAYNLPIFLFGLIAQESQDALLSLKVFTGMLTASILYDIIWMFNGHRQHWLITLLLVLILLLKFPTALSFVTALRQRGASFSGLNIRGNDLGGPTVWSMPGGFSTSFGGGRDGYQNVEDPPEGPRPLSVPPSQPPHAQPVPTPAPVPGTYQSA
ncbi:hypothetical protein C8Q80DRAFT_70131 [Daedaleopsis nitida]|nr:hypothetical protein C8Q80DRAFT_70131 [Daedaleopsis nitida]